MRNGIVKTTDKKTELTLLLVGETGVGKTSFLSLIANVLAGNELEEYVDLHDLTNEKGGLHSQSQTNSAKVYELESKNGITIRILDTPGLADTRGVSQDEIHKRSIANAIKEHIEMVNGVLILANGTIPRLGVATDYALSTLSSVFPRTLADNIAIMFTNVSSTQSLSFNFKQSSLPNVLRNAEQFSLDNPVAMQKKYYELRRKRLEKAMLRQLRDDLVWAESDALAVLSNLFDWLNKRVPQPTKEIFRIYEESRAIDKSMTETIARLHQAEAKRQNLKQIIRDNEKFKVVSKHITDDITIADLKQ